ncbi:MAG: TlpA disulfide reductase family protein [Actinomycetota bacterium]
MSVSPTPRPSRRHFILGAAGLPVLLAACSGDDDEVLSLTNEPTPVEDIQSDEAVGSEVDIDFATFDGGTANFTAYAGQPLVINFFARTCPACVSEMPEFEEVFNEFGGDVAFVGISTDPRLEDAEFLVDETGVTYDLGWDPDAELFQRFGGFAMPTTVFVDASGVVQKTWSGVLTGEDLTAKILEIA